MDSSCRRLMIRNFLEGGILSVCPTEQSAVLGLVG